MIERKHLLILTGCIYFLYIFILPKQCFESDMWCWIHWSIYIADHSLGSAYSGPTNYPPLFQYILWAFAKIQGSHEAIISNMYVMKAFILLFDFAGAWLVAGLAGKPERRGLYFLVLILNPVFLYNTLLWGQVDAVHSFFLLLGVVASVRGKILPAGVLFLLAINFKLQSVIYLPVIGLFLLPELVKKKRLAETGMAILSLAILQFLIILPFFLNGELHKLLGVVFGAVDYYPVLSANAYNIWYWIVPGDAYAIEDTLLVAGMPAKSWGLAMFFASSFFLLFPVFIILLKHWYRSAPLPTSEKWMDIGLITGALVTMNMFFFATQMHERYSHIAMLFTCAYAFRHSKWVILVLFFTAYFLNMEAVYQYLAWENYRTFIYEPKVVAVVYFCYILLMYKDLYKNYFLKK